LSTCVFLLTSTGGLPKLLATMEMRHSMWVRVGFVLLVCCADPAAAWAGAWTLPRKRWYAEYFYRYFGSKKEFDAEGNSGRRAKTAMFQDIRNEWKVEYGLADGVNLLASIPYQSSHYRDDNVDLLNTGVGDIFVRTKLRMSLTPVVSSVQFSWKIPSAYDPAVSPGLGDGQVDFESRLLLSRSFTFKPYTVTLPPTSTATGTTWAGTRDRPAPPQATARSRQEAIRQAMVTATLYQRGRELWDQGRLREAMQWLRAVLENNPGHEEAQRLIALISPGVEGSFISQARLRTASSTQLAAPPPPIEETRYAGVAFLNFESAFTARNEDPANEVPLVFEAGFTPFKRLMLVGSLESVMSIKTTREQEEDFAKWGVRAILNVWGDGFASVFREDVGTTVNVEMGYDDIFYGRNTADAFELFMKLGFFF